MTFRPYVEQAGWKLCPIKDGQKAPRGDNWNSPKKALTAEQAEHVTAAGLMHAYSGTCAFDLDNVDLARAWLAPRGIDLNTLINAPDAVHISSGTSNRGKLLYALPTPLPTKKIVEGNVTLFELRCGTTGGKSMQDLLPPSPHPSGRHYEWKYGDDLTGEWRNLPLIPPALHALWLEMLGPRAESPAASTGESPVQSVVPAPRGDLDEALRILAQHDPDCSYDEWLALGMALEHDLGDAGFALWDSWSAKGKKYPGAGQLQQHWQSFGRNSSATPVTLGSFKRTLVSTRDDFDDVVAEAATKAGRATPVVWEDIDAIRNRPMIEWLIYPWLRKTDLIFFSGPPASGKSLLALEVALALVRGDVEFGPAGSGLEVIESGAVYWFAAEAAGSMNSRLDAYALGHGCMEARDIDAALRGKFFMHSGCNLLADDFVERYAPTIQPGTKLIVIDTVFAATPGADANSSADLGPALANARALHQRTGATVILTAHPPKELGSAIAGTVAQEGTAEVVYTFRKAKGAHRVTTHKDRDGEEGRGLIFHPEVVQVGTDARDKAIRSAFVRFTGTFTGTEEADGGEAPNTDAPAGRSKRVCDILEEHGRKLPYIELRRMVADSLPAPAGDVKRDQRFGNAKLAIADCEESGFVRLVGIQRAANKIISGDVELIWMPPLAVSGEGSP